MTSLKDCVHTYRSVLPLSIHSRSHTADPTLFVPSPVSNCAPFLNPASISFPLLSNNPFHNPHWTFRWIDLLYIACQTRYVYILRTYWGSSNVYWQCYALEHKEQRTGWSGQITVHSGAPDNGFNNNWTDAAGWNLRRAFSVRFCFKGSPNVHCTCGA